MIEFLGQNFELSLGYLVKKHQLKIVSDFVSKVNISKSYSKIVDRPRNIKNLILSMFKNIPLSVYRNYDSEFKTNISKEIYSYDVVIVDHFLMAQYVPKDFKGKVILHQHNAEFVMWERFSKISNNFVKKLLLKFESLRIKKYEAKICSRANVVLASPNDIQILKNISSDTEYKETFHLGDDSLLQFYHPGFSRAQEQITYIGSLDWEANIDGLRWFIESCWQDILFENPKATLKIIGKGVSEDFKSFCNKFEKIELLGFVDSLEDELSKTKVLIAPLRFGSGMKVKTINSLYTGIPLVTTSIGAEGISIEDEVHFCKADKADEQVRAISKLMSEKDYWDHIGGEARELAKRKYTWKKNLENLKEVIDGGNKVCEHHVQSTKEKFAA
jgi:glycosyltransferase involved in cell wall biosynthesis